MMEHNFLLGALSLDFLALMAASAGTAHAQTGDSELARDLANPLSDLTSVPFQFNCDANIRGLGIVP